MASDRNKKSKRIEIRNSQNFTKKQQHEKMMKSQLKMRANWPKLPKIKKISPFK